MFLTGVIPLGESKLITAKADNGEIYVAVKPMADELGIDWTGQFKKVVKDERYGHMSIPLKLAEGGLQEMICIPHKKVLPWLFSISPNKVKPEQKAKLIAFQEETEWAIYEYWTKGEAKKSEFVDSDAFKALQEKLMSLVLEKMELKEEMMEHQKTIYTLTVDMEAQRREFGWEAFLQHQDKLAFLHRMKQYAEEFYAMMNEVETLPNGYGTYSIRKKLDGFARKMWAQYSTFRDELERLEAQGA